MRGFRLHLFQEVCRLFSTFDQVYWVTIIPAGTRRPLGQLASFRPPEVHRRF
jgi:hypothetical protein